MRITFEELSCKEVVNICDGKRLGYTENLEINMVDGKIISLIIPGPSKMFGLIQSQEDYVIPFGKIVKVGDDVILVEYDHAGG